MCKGITYSVCVCMTRIKYLLDQPLFGLLEQNTPQTASARITPRISALVRPRMVHDIHLQSLHSYDAPRLDDTTNAEIRLLDRSYFFIKDVMKSGLGSALISIGLCHAMLPYWSRHAQFIIIHYSHILITCDAL